MTSLLRAVKREGGNGVAARRHRDSCADIKLCLWRPHYHMHVFIRRLAVIAMVIAGMLGIINFVLWP
jgi:hypothetical protein